MNSFNAVDRLKAYGPRILDDVRGDGAQGADKRCNQHKSSIQNVHSKSPLAAMSEFSETGSRSLLRLPVIEEPYGICLEPMLRTAFIFGSA